MTTKEEDWRELVNWIGDRVEDLAIDMRAHEEHKFMGLREQAYTYKRCFQRVLGKMEQIERRTEKVK